MVCRSFTAGAAAALAITIAGPAFFLAVPAAAETTLVATVGPSAGCEFDDLQQAVDFLSGQAAERRVVRIERGTYEDVALAIAADQLEIIGGFESCGDAQPGIGRSGLLAAPGSRAVTIEPGPEPRSFVRLANLRIADGFTLTGGGVQVVGAVDVVLDRTLVIGNDAAHGGGIYLADVPPLLDGRPAEAGGGPTLTLRTGSGVNGNRAILGDTTLGGGSPAEAAVRSSGRREAEWSATRAEAWAAESTSKGVS